MRAQQQAPAVKRWQSLQAWLLLTLPPSTPAQPTTPAAPSLLLLLL
jgi:hypothetical protein